jgi:hypothetical protein
MVSGPVHKIFINYEQDSRKGGARAKKSGSKLGKKAVKKDLNGTQVRYFPTNNYVKYRIYTRHPLSFRRKYSKMKTERRLFCA